MSDDYDPAKDSYDSFNLCISSLRERLEKSKVVIGDCTLYNEDCRFILPTLQRVDHVIMDPPYEGEAHNPGRRLNGNTLELKHTRVREIHAAPLDFDAMTPDLRSFIGEECGRLSSGWLLAFCQVEAVPLWREAFAAGNAAYRRAMIWVKPDSSPQLSGDRPAQGYETIVASWAGRGASIWNGGGRRGVFTFGKHDAGVGHGGVRVNAHPTQKPIALMSDLVTLFSEQGNTILDPFMGSGTTGVACVKLGRKFIGIEREQKYFDTACRRIREAYAQPDFFVSAPEKKPEQVNLF